MKNNQRQTWKSWKMRKDFHVHDIGAEVWDVDGVKWEEVELIADSALVHNIVSRQSRYYNVTIAIAFFTIRIHDMDLHNSHNSRV